MRLLARMKGLRGGRFDVFGWTRERRRERGLIVAYQDMIDGLLLDLTPAAMALAVEIAETPDAIRGFGPVKEASMDAYEAECARLLARWRDAANRPQEG